MKMSIKNSKLHIIFYYSQVFVDIFLYEKKFIRSLFYAEILTLVFIHIIGLQKFKVLMLDCFL